MEQLQGETRKQLDEHWTRLSRQIEFHKPTTELRGWSGFVFTDSEEVVHELQSRSKRQLQEQGLNQIVLRPDTPSELIQSLNQIRQDSSFIDKGCIWIEALKQGDEWSNAWDKLLSELNLKRDSTRNYLQGGLILAARKEIKPMAFNSPDIWSTRGIVIEIN